MEWEFLNLKERIKKTMEIKDFGVTKGKEVVKLVTLKNQNGMKMSVTNYGASLVSLHVPDKNGEIADVVLGYDDLLGYEENAPFLGNTIGRSGNRIANANFVIDGITYNLCANENKNSLHSCPNGYNSRVWEIKEIDEEKNAITFSLWSPDLEQGFPGNLQIEVTYSLTNENEVKIYYNGKSDKKTVINLTNHSYFNLAGHNAGNILEHKLKIAADEYVPVQDSASIPTGELACVTNTPMDFTEFKSIGADINANFEQLNFTGGYDHNYALKTTGAAVELVAEVIEEKTNRKMQVFTDLPGVQFYAGNAINQCKGKAGAVYTKRSGFCLETQYFPDAVNQPEFVSPIFDANEIYETTTIYKFSW